jgi:hypothetical protein
LFLWAPYAGELITKNKIKVGQCMAFVTFGLMTCFGIGQGNEYLVRKKKIIWGANLSIKTQKMVFRVCNC